MTLLIVLIVLLVLTIVLVSEQALRRIEDAGAAARAEEIAASLDQLGELERKVATGLFGAEEAEATRAAIRSRVLAAGNQRTIPLKFSPRVRKLAGLAMASLVIVGLAALYQRYDSPLEWSDGSTKPSSASAPQDGPGVVEALAAATATTAEQAPSGSLVIQPPAEPQRPPQRTLGSVDEMIDRLVKRLDRNPNDVEGWRMLGWSYVNTDRYGPAVTAYAKASALSPDNADIRSAYGEALVRRADGRVTDEARSAFAAALGIDGKDARARFFMGLAKEQDGDKRAALADWMAIMDQADSKEPWFADLKQRVAELGRALGVDVTSRLPSGTLAPSAGGSGTRIRAVEAANDNEPTDLDVGNAEVTAPPDRDAAIRAMVEGLATRLAQSPDDVEGWARLIRSREVLGETDEAKRTLQHALDVFKAAPQDQARIAAVARELGLMQ
jgi:cytochrome c-type biogenesis protein CcmH